MSVLDRIRRLAVKRSTARTASRVRVIEKLDPSDMKAKLQTARDKIVDLRARMTAAETEITDLKARVTTLEGGG